MKLPAYPRTKPSGVEWLGEVPGHWEIVRFRNIVLGGVTNGLFKTQDAFGDGTRLINVYDAYRGDFNVDEQSLERVATTAAELRLYRVHAGDIFFVRSSLKLEGVGRAICCLNPTEDLVFECHLVRAHPDFSRIYPRFLILYLNSQFVVHSLIAAAKTTTMATISQPKMLDLPVLLPALPEQHAIAAFLDRETGRVDRLVTKKRELIERLKEKRTALISRTVTRGLPPAAARAAGLPENPPLKPCGLDWLDEIPDHWEVKRLSYLATLKSGENITSEMIAEGGDYPVYGGNGLRGNYHKVTHRGHYVLIGRQGALCGNINYASGEFWASEHALVVLPLKKLSVVWLGELLRAMNLGQYSVTAAQPGIAAEVIRALRIPVPPLPEQAAIAAYLDKETAKLDALVGKVEEAVERLQEYRTALITAAVTGKIDVRGVSA